MTMFASPTFRRCSQAVLAALALICAMASGAFAQERFAIENFDTAPDRDGAIVTVHGARTLDPGKFGVSVMGSYGRSPLSLKSSSSGDSLGDLVGSVSTFQLLGSVGIAKRLDLALALPLHRMSSGSEFDVDPGPSVNAYLLTSSQVGLGDLRVVPRLALLPREKDSGVGLALLAPVWLPTGDEDIYAGEDVRVEPRLALDGQEGRVHLAFNVGYMIRNSVRLLNSVVDDQLRFGAGAEVALAGGLSGLIEVNSQLNVLADDFGKDDAPTEGLLGLRLRKAGILAELGGGPGMVRGVGAPSYRLYASIGYARMEEPVRDADGDGVLDDKDRCPENPEDADGFEDNDGCPDADNDRDGVPDASDRCVNDPEDADSYEDADGCPDPDNDRDGIADATDRCANQPEDTDGFEDTDGCPDPDNDQDGVPDAADACPDQPGTPEAHGCPAAQAAPPPPATQALVTVTDDRIEIHEKVQFAINSAVIEGSSDGLLDAIAETLNAHPEILEVRVEAHTDDTGKRFRNQQLSEQRAEAVMDALIARGIKQRMSFKGYGPSKPLVPNDSDENRSKNRRAELIIVKRAELVEATPAPAAPPPAVPPAP